jgi:hypothetical protein
MNKGGVIIIIIVVVIITCGLFNDADSGSDCYRWMKG